MAQVNDLLVLGKANFLNEITSSQLLRALGGIVVDSSTEESTSLPYFLGIKAFADGGNVVWSSPTNTANVIRLNASGTWPISISGLAAKATADANGSPITSTYAKLKSYNDMIHSSNEYTFASPAYSGAIWINYRTASGATDGNITTYNFGNGKGGTAGVTLVATTFNGNATSANYATSAGSASVASKISDITTNDLASSSATKRRIWFCYDNNATGRPAYDDRFTIQTSTGTLFAPIFSGTLSGNATTATTASYANKINLNGISNDTKYGTYGGIIQDSSTGPNSGAWHNTIKILHNNSTGYYTSIATQFTGEDGLWFRSYRGGTDNGWKRVAVQNMDNTFSSTNVFSGKTTFNNEVYLNATMTWKAPANISCVKDGSNAECSFDVAAGVQWHVWSSPHGASMLSCYADNKYVQVHHHLQVGGYNNSSYALTADSFICNSWIRTTNETGWYNETHGGGWYMTNNKAVRTYNGKPIQANGAGNGSRYIAYPKGGEYSYQSGSITGYLTIYLPTAAFKSSTMLKFKVSIYNYSTSQTVDYIISGYNYNDGQWYNPTAICISPRNDYGNLTVRYGHNGSRNTIQIGESSTVWSYPNVTISDVTLGHSATFDNWIDGWEIGITTSAIGNVTQTVSNTGLKYNAMIMTHANGYWGMGTPTGADNEWIRTTTLGIIPYQSGGHGSIGTSSWPFNEGYFKFLNVTNDNSDNGYDALAYFRHYNNKDWTVKVDSGSYDYGLYVINAHTATNAFQVNGGARISNTVRIGNGTALDGNYCEGLRIRAANGQWATIIMGATADTGTNEYAWSIHRKSDNNFCISRNSSDGANGLVMTATGMGLGTTNPSYRLQVNGSIGANGNIYIGTNSGAGNGLSLYSTSSPNSYGIHMSYTSNYSAYGQVTSDWATYFCFDGDVKRGWIFKHAGTNVFSINGQGTLSIRENVPGIFFRPGHASYDANISYQTSGNEAMVFTTKNAVTSFIFANGEDTVSNISSSRWTALTPGLQIKQNCVSIGKLIADSTSPGYKLEVGGTSRFNDTVFGYAYNVNNNKAAFMWDKSGSYYTGMGANGAADTIQFRACDANGSWVDHRQHWHFYGDLYAYGARFANRGASTSTSAYGDSAVEIREYNFGGVQDDTWGNAPRLSFHWGGRVAAQIGLASEGNLYINNNASASTAFVRIVGMAGFGTGNPSGAYPAGTVYFKYS